MAISSLPEDALLEVFTRLSLRSLMRLRCVSKSWHALIDGPEFIQMHLNRSSMYSEAQRYVFEANLFDRPDKDNTFTFYTASFDLAQKSKITLEELDCPNIPNISKDVRLVGSCNGLLCIVQKNTRVIFWNPWIRKSFVLPKSPIQRRVGAYPLGLHLQFGFGYDKTTDDYKVVRIAHNPVLSPPLVQNPVPAFCEVKLYSRKSNSWKKLQNIPFSIRYTDERCSGVLLNGAFHWIVDGDQIGAIHTRTEEHKLVQTPESLDKGYKWNLGLLDGCLCMFPKSCGASVHVNLLLVQLWVMKDYGVEDSWTKLTFELSVMNCIRPCFVTLIGWYCAEGNKQLVLKKNDKEFLWYDIGNRRLVETTKVPGGRETMRRAYHCVCSLVHPDGGGRTRKGIKRSRD